MRSRRSYLHSLSPSHTHTHTLHMQRNPGKRSAHTLMSFTLCTGMPNPRAGHVPVLVCSVLYMCVHGSQPWTGWLLTLSFAHEPPACHQTHKHTCAYAFHMRKELALSSPGLVRKPKLVSHPQSHPGGGAAIADILADVSRGWILGLGSPRAAAAIVATPVCLK